MYSECERKNKVTNFCIFELDRLCNGGLVFAIIEH